MLLKKKKRNALALLRLERNILKRVRTGTVFFYVKKHQDTFFNSPSTTKKVESGLSTSLLFKDSSAIRDAFSHKVYPHQISMTGVFYNPKKDMSNKSLYFFSASKVFYPKKLFLKYLKTI